MFLKKRAFGTLSVLGVFLVGCETSNPSENLNVTAPSSRSAFKATKEMHPHVAQAFALLKEGQYTEASSHINQTLQSQPKSVILHILNALTYEKLAETGDAASIELAVIGYQNALNIDPFNSFAITQLGKIRYREQQYDSAQEHFANALLIKPNDPDLIHEFAAASYYAYDIKTALASIKKAEQLKPNDPLIHRSAAMMHAAVGDFKAAEKHFNLFKEKVGNDPQVEHVASRFNDWQSLYKSGRLMLAAAQTNSNSSSSDSSDSDTADSGDNESDSKDSRDSDSGDKKSKSTDSDSNDSGDSGSGNNGSASSNAESEDLGLTVDNPVSEVEDTATKDQFARGDIGRNTVSAPVTPGIEPPKGGPGPQGPGGPQQFAPKEGAPVTKADEAPEHIIMDCYILQIAEDARTSKGNNILQNLAVTLSPGGLLNYKASMWGNGAPSVARASTTDSVTFTPQRGFNVPIKDPTDTQTSTVNLNNAGSISGRVFTAGLTWAGLSYSLNIANAADLRTQIVSRPTLMTYLKKESRFFSGIELVNVSSGSFGGNLSRYQIGITLAVTPESIIKDMVTLNIGVEASIQNSPNPDLLTTVDVNKTRVETTAKVRLGETILLGGIYERNEVDTQAGFPGLRDVPFLQYFFSNQTTLSTRKSIVILLTPRSPGAVKSAVNRAMTRESIKPHFSELKVRNPDWFDPDTNATKIFSYVAEDPVLYYEFRTGDILPPSWGYDVTLKDKLGELSSFLWY